MIPPFKQEKTVLKRAKFQQLKKQKQVLKMFSDFFFQRVFKVIEEYLIQLTQFVFVNTKQSKSTELS